MTKKNWKCKRCKAEWVQVVRTAWGAECPRCHGDVYRINVGEKTTADYIAEVQRIMGKDPHVERR